MSDPFSTFTSNLLDDAMELSKRSVEIINRQQSALADARTFAANIVAAHQEIEKMRDARDEDYRKAIVLMHTAIDEAARKYQDRDLATIARQFDGFAA